MTAIWKIPSKLPRAFTPHYLWTKTAFMGPTLNFDQIYISAMEHDINNRKETGQSTGTLLHAPYLVNFGPETAENGWRFFTPPP